MATGNIDVTTEETDSCNKDGEESSDYHSDLSLIDMPVEIIIKICNFLDSKYVVNLRLVCKRFCDILSDDRLWRKWMRIRLRRCMYPPLGEDLYSLREDCVLIDNINNEWQKSKQIKIVAEDTHSADIDALLMKNDGTLCISGSRDRTIVIWNLKQLAADHHNNFDMDNENKFGKRQLESSTKSINAHEGWIWDLASPTSNSDMFLSCSWDSTIKLWDLPSVQEVHCFKCPSAALCISCIDENVTITGLSSAILHLFDKRCVMNPVSTYREHQRSILSITTKAPGSNTIFSASEDRTIGVFDMRKDGFIKMVEIFKTKHRASEIPLKVVANDQKCKNALFIGDTFGTLQTFNMQTLKVMYVNNVWSSEHRSNKMTGLAMDSGVLSACSANGSVVLMNPSEPPNLLMNYVLEDNMKFTATSILNNTLVCGNNNQVRFWLPSNFNQ